MHTNLFPLILIGLLAGFFVRPLSMFVFSTVFSLEKYTRTKTQGVVLIIATAMSTLTLSFSAVYVTLKLFGFIPLGDMAPTFILSFFGGGALWVIYAIVFNRQCTVDFDNQ